MAFGNGLLIFGGYVNTFALKRFQYILIVSGFLLLLSCGNNQENSQEQAVEIDSTTVRYKPLPPLASISEEKMNTISQWKKFRELSILMERFQRQNHGDLTYYTEEFIRLNSELAKDSLMPEKFDKPAVRSRIVVLNTFTKQLKNRLDESSVIDSINIARERVLNSYNALRLQLAEHLKSKLFEKFLKEQEKKNKEAKPSE